MNTWGSAIIDVVMGASSTKIEYVIANGYYVPKTIDTLILDQMDIEMMLEMFAAKPLPRGSFGAELARLKAAGLVE